MTNLSDIAMTILEALPKDGSKIGNIKLRDKLGLPRDEYLDARDELLEAKKVSSGRGRGGTLGLIEVSTSDKKPEPESKDEESEATTSITPKERMAIAREAKRANQEIRKEIKSLQDAVLSYVHEHGYKSVKAQDISFSEGRPVIAVWDGRTAHMYTVPQLEWDKLRATV